MSRSEHHIDFTNPFPPPPLPPPSKIPLVQPHTPHLITPYFEQNGKWDFWAWRATHYRINTTEPSKKWCTNGRRSPRKINRKGAKKKRAVYVLYWIDTGLNTSTLSVNSMVNTLGWPSLDERRQVARLSMLFKVHHGQVHCSCLKLKEKIVLLSQIVGDAAMTDSSIWSRQGPTIELLRTYLELSKTGTIYNKKQLRPGQ